MLDNKGFDLWADRYDKSVNFSEESNEYPFAGYKNVLNNIYTQVRQKDYAEILDIGFGTEILNCTYNKISHCAEFYLYQIKFYIYL